MNPIKQKVIDILKFEIKKLYEKDLEITLDNPPKKELWDFAFGCFILAKELSKSPNVIAWELIENLKNYNEFSKLEIAWPYLNIKLSLDFYSKVFKESDLLSIPNIWNWEKLVVDYTWINVWKPMHIWHVCPSSQWQVTINLANKLGFDVISDTHIWDWWIIFWKLITAYKLWWDDKKLQENAVDYLLELYVKITSQIEIEAENQITKLEEQTREEFKLLSEWNPDSIEMWKNFTKYSISAMKIMLKRLWVEVEFNIWESFYEGLNLPKMENYPDLTYSMSDIVKELIEKNIATKNEDWSVWVVFPEVSKIPSCILQKNNWTHGYLASDLACVKYRMQNWNPKKIIYHVDVRQQLHLKQVFEISKMAWWLENDTELFHAYNWFISLKDWAMSSRKWNIIKLDSLLDEAHERAKKIILEKRDDISWEKLEELSEIIWVWAIKYWYLSKSRTSDMIFDWDEFMTFEWNSGPFVSYAYVRSLNILKNSKIELAEIINSNSWEFTHQTEVDLFKELCEFNQVLLDVSKNYLPHNLVNYTFNLTKKFNWFYNEVNVINEENLENKLLKLKLVYTFNEILKTSFDILAIKLPTEM